MFALMRAKLAQLGQPALNCWAAWGALGMAHLGVLAVLRAAWLLRPDPFGQPAVGKADWYLFHAVGYDAVATVAALLWLLPLAVAGAWLPAVWQRRACGAGGLAIAAVATALALVGQADFEVMRFVGTHLNRALVQTYANPTLAGELPRLLRHDAGGPYVGLLLFLVAPAAQAAWMGRWWRRPQVHRRAFVALLAIALAGKLLTVLWPGATWKTAPVLQIAQGLLTSADRPVLAAELRAKATAEHQARWRAANPAAAAIFPAPDLPLLHVTPHQACRMAMAATGCDRDQDGDGAPLQRDCDDRDPAVHPGAAEVPSDGVDQDCSGADDKPWNFLVVILESHRGMSVSHVPGGLNWSPELDKLARQGMAQGRGQAAALPTIGAFMAIHTGLWACTREQVATYFTLARLPSLPAVLGRHGYDTHFFSAFDPAFDNQNVWLRQWYAHIHYDRSRQEDAELLQHVGEFIPSLPADRPFFVAVTTRTNHFGFDRVAGVAKTGGESWPERMKDTMGYADAALGKLVATLRRDPKFARTVLIVTGDHGYPLGEHGSWYLYESLHVEAAAVPIVIAGGHPKLAGLAGTLAMEPATHADLAPTVLDLAGIDLTGSWAGRSLLRAGQGSALTFKDGHFAIERGRLRVIGQEGQAGQLQAYDRVADPRETAPLAVTVQAKELAAEALRASDLMRDVYVRDAVLPSGWGPAGAP